ncbi:MAG: metallohydrolase [Gammaproteobacteria bacterium]|nr:metallohydrolase [Gammaproteobacteria bacterium]
MPANIAFLPVDNGDMVLLTLENGKRVLIDCNIRDVSGDDPPPDVIKQLKDRLLKDDKGRYYVDAFLLSHPDQDHCRGFKSHFYTGAASDFPADSKKIFIKELWSSPLIFRRKTRHHVLCEDAQAFNAEARRRVRRYRESGTAWVEGDRVLILGEDESPEKQQDLGAIVVKTDTRFNAISGQYQSGFSAYLLAPQPKGSDEDEERRSKNNSSVILQISVGAGWNAQACRFLCGGDAEVDIWEDLWQRHRRAPDCLQYDVLLAPHHCSWHCLSHDSISDLGDKAQVAPDAKSALSQILDYGRIVASSKEILDDDDDPPSNRAKQEYDAIAKGQRGRFYETSAYNGEPFELEITEAGPSPKKVSQGSKSSTSTSKAGAIGAVPLAHG